MSDEPTSHYVDGYRPVTVDLSTLATFAKTLHDEVNLNFGPHAQRVTDALDPGVAPVPSDPDFLELKATRDRYLDCRDTAISMLDKYRRVTLEIAEAAATIEQNYRGSDAYVRAQVTQVKDAFNAAATKYGSTGA
jgi:hypothetical protein